MEILNLQQGSHEWHQARATKFTASEAPAMMGDSKYMSRDELLHQKKTGEVPEVSPAQQRIFDRGHAVEELARPVAEAIIGDELYPATGVDGDYLASFDGITMLHDVAFEHKLINDAFRALRPTDGLDFVPEDLDPHYYWQLEHQSLVSGCEKILFMASDGTEEDMVYCWYQSIPERRDQLIAGWAQFAKDLESFEPAAPVVEVEAAPIKDLPAITYELNGLALSSNLDIYREAAEQLVEESKKPLEDDQDFADRDALVKKFKEAEDKIKLVQQQVVGEIHDVDTFCKELGYIGELIRQARLNGEKLVKSEKDRKKAEIINEAKSGFLIFLEELNAELDEFNLVMPEIPMDLIGAIKGKKKLNSLRSAANDEVAKAKIAAGSVFDLIKINYFDYQELAGDFTFLFPDLQQLIIHPSEAFSAMVKARIAGHEKAEREKREAEEAAQKEAESQQQEEPQKDQKPLELDDVLEAAAPEEVAQAMKSPKPITMITIAEFLKDCASNEDAIDDFGHLLVPEDKQINDEALFNLKNRLKEFCGK